MRAPHPSTVFYTVLCEDLQAWTFVRAALIAAGAQARNIRNRPFPDNRFQAQGAGHPRRFENYTVYACGSQHVRENYAAELSEVRVQHARRNAALVVHIDVDNETPHGRTVQDRVNELASACMVKAVPVRTGADPVALIIPRRNIETWIHNLSTGKPVAEHAEYPKLTGHEGDAVPAAQQFTQHTRAGTVPPSAPPSLAQGIKEFSRVV